MLWMPPKPLNSRRRGFDDEQLDFCLHRNGAMNGSAYRASGFADESDTLVREHK